MKNSFNALAASLSILLAATLAGAQQQDKPGCKDHPLVSRYPGSVIRDCSAREFDEYELPLGPATSKGFEKSQRLAGKLAFIFYKNAPGRTSLEVLTNYEAALRQAGFQILFACKQQECGRLTNTHLGWFGFTSPSEYSRYLAAKLARAEGDVYVALNVYEHPVDASRTTTLHVVETKPMEAGLVTVDAAALASDIERTGKVAIYGIYFDTGKAELKPESEPTLQEIAKLLQQKPELKLHVVGHTDSVGELVMNMDLSKRRAQAVVQALTSKHGVAAARLRPDGVGPLAPVASNKTEDGRAKNRRVELVEQ